MAYVSANICYVDDMDAWFQIKCPGGIERNVLHFVYHPSGIYRIWSVFPVEVISREDFLTQILQAIQENMVTPQTQGLWHEFDVYAFISS